LEVGDWPITVPAAFEPMTAASTATPPEAAKAAPTARIWKPVQVARPPAHSKYAELRSRFLNHSNELNEAY
jgi:hypothetical protein